MIVEAVRRKRVRGIALASLIATQACTSIPIGPAAVPQPAPRSPSACCSALERGVLAELNRARTQPARFAAELEARLPHFRGYIYRPPASEVGTRTVEGQSAVREAVRALRARNAVPALRLSAGMSAGAADHVRDHGPIGETGHTGRDRSTPASRISRYGRWFGVVSENIQYGRGTNAHDVVAELLIDDGVPDRGHRRNALDPNIRVAGLACGPHATYGQMCVIVHARDYAERATSEPAVR
jgi:uncharacterized protein YkwD